MSALAAYPTGFVGFAWSAGLAFAVPAWLGAVGVGGMLVLIRRGPLADHS